VNSGTTTATCQDRLAGSDHSAPPPVEGNHLRGAHSGVRWIYKDQSKVFVHGLKEWIGYRGQCQQVPGDEPPSLSARPPIKAAQSNDGNYIYVLNGGAPTTRGSLSIIDGQGGDGERSRW